MAALISGDADIGLMGPEASIYIYNQGEEDYAVNFAQLTQCDGSFLVSREKIDNFSYEDLKGKEVLGGRAGGVPLMTLEYVLKQNGVEIGEDKDKGQCNVCLLYTSKHEDMQFYKKQLRVALRNCGHINPEDISEYIANDGYLALAKCLDCLLYTSRCV